MVLRKTQKSILKEIANALDLGKTDIFIAAPTGSGKSILALEVSRALNFLGKDSYILTSEKSLQEQYEHDCTIKFAPRHEDAVSICGMDTYKCSVNNEKFSLGVCRNIGLSNPKALELKCAKNCEYLQRWSAAKDSNRVIMNYPLFILQMNYVYQKLGDKAPFQKRNIVICDEAHKLPDIIESHFACRINRHIPKKILFVINNLKNLGYKNTLNISELESCTTKALSISETATPDIHHEALKKLYKAYDSILGNINSIKTELASRYTPGNHTPDALKEFSKTLPSEVKSFLAIAELLKDIHCKIEDYVEMIELHGLENLVACDSDKDERTYHNLSDTHLFHKHFKPFSDTRIYMSATLQPELLISRWSLDINKCHIIEVHSDWDVDKSPVVCCNSSNMGHQNGGASITAAISKIDDILKTHRNERGVIHTTTNAIAEELINYSKYSDRLHTYSGTAEKIELLKNLHKLPGNAVIVGPSLFTGIDLNDDLGRFNILVKLGYPNVGSQLWAKRFNLQPDVYFGETAAVIEQSAGRTTRHEDDWSTTYIIDNRAKSFINRNRKYFSQSFLNRII